MKPIKLTRTKTGWQFRDIIIERHHWILPYSYTGYFMIRNGKRIEEHDSLKDVRETLQFMLEEGEL